MKIRVRTGSAATLAAMLASVAPAPAAEPVLVQCGREYQAARTAGTLNGADWNTYRIACADRLKAGPSAAGAAATGAAAAVAPPPATPIPSAPIPSTPAAPLPVASTPPSAGTAAMHARQKQCGAEWTGAKAALVAATPGLTWPKYWSQCNARLKASAFPPPAAQGR